MLNLKGPACSFFESETVVVEISFVRQLVAQLESPHDVNQMMKWDNLGNEAVNPKLFVVSVIILIENDSESLTVCSL